MNLVADECVAFSLVERLRADGHAVLSVLEDARSEADPRVLALAAARVMPLLTEVKDFGELADRLAAEHRGVILVRFPGIARSAKLELVSRAIRERGPEFIDRFAVITPGAIRIRAADTGEPPG